MTDYDAIRTCCSGADICRHCWMFIAAAVRVLDRALRDQFGYKHLLWVYSGRRGIHLWISDREALELTDDQRKALVGWLTVIQGGKEMAKKVEKVLEKEEEKEEEKKKDKKKSEKKKKKEGEEGEDDD